MVVRPLGNNSDGIRIDGGAKYNRIGTKGWGAGAESEGNLISGNLGTGITISGSSTEFDVVAGNYIGSDLHGFAAIPNASRGIRISGRASNNRIGTDGNGVGDVIQGNLISGNLVHGVEISGVGTGWNVVAGNFIGTDVTGTTALGNRFGGIQISGGAHHNRIGTDGNGMHDELERNVISVNLGHGVYIAGSGSDVNIVDFRSHQLWWRVDHGSWD